MTMNINLAPPTELENKLWYAPDIMCAIITYSIISLVTGSYISAIKDDIETIKNETIQIENNIKRLEPYIKKQKSLVKEISSIKKKLVSLKNITISKISRFKPVIILEHLQNLKPEGVWFTNVRDDSVSSVIHISGGAFDNLLIAEFMSALNETQFHEPQMHNLRSQMYFSKIYLEQIARSDAQQSSATQAQPTSEDQLQQAFDSMKDQSLLQEGGGGQSQTQNLFPEVNRFPTFSLKLKYKSRSPKRNKIKRSGVN